MRPPIRLCPVVAGTLALAAALAAPAAESPKPNIVLILADDQGWGDLSVHGNTNLATPRIDSLARDGARFERFYVSPVCSPTRASLLTGRYHTRSGVTTTSRGGERMALDETTIADVFRAAGYATGAFGKWHNGAQYPYHPNGRGFEEFYGFCSGHWGHYFDPRLERNGEDVRGRGFIADDLTDKALAFIDARKDRPFLCYVAYNTPHSPFQVPDRNFDRFKDWTPAMKNRDPKQEEVATTRAALALCENLDENVGRILDGIDAAGLRERTIVIYLSDNGPNSWRWNDGMLGRKGSVEEGGVRVPFLIRWPGHIPAGKRVDRIASHIDLLPTLAGLADVALKTAKPLDGISLVPLLTGDGRDWSDRMIFSTWRNRVTVRTQRYRASEKALYDMIADPGQRENLAKRQPDVHRKLAAAITRFRAEAMGRAPEEEQPFPVGHKAFPRTVLPAQDGRFEVPLRYSGRFPNAAWITNWTGADAHPTWDIAVKTAGRYAVTLLYTCPPADVGSEIEVSFEGKTLRGKIAEGFDPPLIEANDRVPRAESYDKPFKPLALGTMDLPAGRGLLRVRALSVPGKTVMDLRAVILRLEP